MKNAACLFLTLALLSACATQPTTPVANRPDTPAVMVTDAKAIAKLQDPLKTQTVINSGINALERGDKQLASELLTLVSIAPNNETLHLALIEYASLLAADPSTRAAALTWYSNNPYASNDFEQSASHARLHLATQLAEQALVGLLEALPALTADTKFNDYNKGIIWEALKASSNEAKVAAKIQPANSYEMAGWLALTDAFGRFQRDWSELRTALIDWQLQWPNHPAETDLPNDIAEVLQTQTDFTITALLPLTGKFSHIGAALQDGLLLAHANSGSTHRLSFIDTSNKTLTDLMNTPEVQQADMLIGPIEKPLVNALANSALIAPIISLNRPEVTANEAIAIGDDSATMLSLTLAIEDEAKYLAQHTIDSFEHALVLETPHPLATRSAAAYRDEWAALVAATESTDDKPALAPNTFALSNHSLTTQDQYSEQIKQSLLLKESHTRLRALEDTFIQRMENNPRRRQDISHIFLAATPAQARAVKPMLAYHYAGSLPVFATSLVYDGNPVSNQNRDLNNIVIADTPWAVTQTPAKRAINQHMQRGGTASKNLHALALDAYHLALIKLYSPSFTDFRFEGYSGAYSFFNAAPDRETALAKFNDGKLEILPQ